MKLIVKIEEIPVKVKEIHFNIFEQKNYNASQTITSIISID